MPSSERRAARARQLIYAYMQVRKLTDQHRKKRAVSLRRQLKLANELYPTTCPTLEIFDEFSDIGFDFDDSSLQLNFTLNFGLIQPIDTSLSLSPMETATPNPFGFSFNLGPLLVEQLHIWGDEDGSGRDIGEDDTDLFDFGMILEGDEDDGWIFRGRSLRKWIVQELQEMYSRRYEVPRDTLIRGPSFLQHVLHTLKNSRIDHFRQALRITPLTFDTLVTAIEQDPIFHNHSGNAQLPVEEQLAITLYRFGHDGNAAGLQGVANWAGVGKGTVVLVTRRVMTAILRPAFMKKAIQMPTSEEKEEAKRWVHQHSCSAWRSGWCFVDGTLIPLSNRPAWYGESYYDRKCRYSLNFQIVSLPNLKIIDYSFGYPGSRHDSVAWQATQLYKEHENLLEGDEWVWADSAYPIQTWVVAPYKAPEKNRPKNEIFNKHVSILRIRSEHAIGFLKGRFQSLKNLRVRIKSKQTHTVATYWVVACIAIHNFALDQELTERRNADPTLDEQGYHDHFIDEGLSDSEDEEGGEGSQESDTSEVVVTRRIPPRLRRAKQRREELKKKLLSSLKRRTERRIQNRTAARRDELGVVSDSDLDLVSEIDDNDE